MARVSEVLMNRVPLTKTSKDFAPVGAVHINDTLEVEAATIARPVGEGKSELSSRSDQYDQPGGATRPVTIRSVARTTRRVAGERRTAPAAFDAMPNPSGMAKQFLSLCWGGIGA